MNQVTINNEAFVLACSKGHTDIVQLLLQDPRVDPTANDNYAFRCARANERNEVVQLLLSDSRVSRTNQVSS